MFTGKRKILNVVSIVVFIMFVIAFLLNTSLIVNEIILSVGLIISIVAAIIIAKKTNIDIGTARIQIIAVACIAATFSSAIGLLLERSQVEFQLSQEQEISSIKNKAVLFYSSEDTDLYFDEHSKIVYSVTESGSNYYIMNAGAVESDKSEYLNTYIYSYEVPTKGDKVTSLTVYLPDIAKFNNNEYGLKIKTQDATYCSKVFISGINHIPSSFKPFLHIRYANPYEDYYENVFKTDSSMFFVNESESFIVPYANVSYEQDGYFRYRFVEYMRIVSDEQYTLPDNMDFKYLNSFNVNSSNVKKIVFYYQISDSTNLEGILMEQILSDGTSNICYLKEIYPENISKIEAA